MKNSNEDRDTRLEQLWAGDFGNDYIDRNLNAYEGRRHFWEPFLKKHPVRNILEVGCNVGGNLRWIAGQVEKDGVYGIDINPKAVRYVRAHYPDINAICSRALELPLRDAWFDMVFTAGVLIHQSEADLARVMSEIHRVSKKYILCMEYYSDRTVEVPYRGVEGALFKRDYKSLYTSMFPGLKLKETGSLSKEQGWDDVTYWLFEK
jgi:pseudaminic acid biosynthesis-associated methylase